MRDFLEFIDSPDIREYNRKTKFAPAEWAVLIRSSRKRTIEEKREALQYLVDRYREEEFGDEKVNMSAPMYPPLDERMPIREVVKKTLAIWQDILDDRNRNEGVVFAAKLEEKGYCASGLTEYGFFSNYGDAFSYLSHEKQEYLGDEDLMDVETIGEIRRIKMGGGYDSYYFDTQMRLVDIEEDEERMIEEEGMMPHPLQSLVYNIFVPLPFRAGDIVKVDNWGEEPYYGVIFRDWNPPEYREGIRMGMSLDLYHADRDEFDYTDGTGDCILNYSLCPDEELPEDKQILKLIRAVRQGKLEWYTLLHKYSRKELDQVLEWKL